MSDTVRREVLRTVTGTVLCPASRPLRLRGVRTQDSLSLSRDGQGSVLSLEPGPSGSPSASHDTTDPDPVGAAASSVAGEISGIKLGSEGWGWGRKPSCSAVCLPADDYGVIY